MNKEDIAVKFVDISDYFIRLNSTNDGLIDSAEFLDELFGSTFHEAVIQKKLDHENILKCREAWLQFRNLETLELVIAMPLCESNLEQYLRDQKRFKFGNIKNFMLQITSALKYLRDLDPPIIHRDVKLGVVT